MLWPMTAAMMGCSLVYARRSQAFFTVCYSTDSSAYRHRSLSLAHTYRPSTPLTIPCPGITIRNLSSLLDVEVTLQLTIAASARSSA